MDFEKVIWSFKSNEKLESTIKYAPNQKENLKEKKYKNKLSAPLPEKSIKMGSLNLCSSPDCDEEDSIARYGRTGPAGVHGGMWRGSVRTKAEAGSWLLRRWDILGFPASDFLVLGCMIVGLGVIGSVIWVCNFWLLGWGVLGNSGWVL
ncbi:hypothetical protein ES332_D03G069800v1 [Gossypium tomentosum]|uniref:Uncharacterized protein n=1 Tax=Gossypium tomentosum TaxID=34277 RepID=A0A5D2LJI0_GOSTO|nr:hypothetical protein ES332_D03G069800v1 [Gossypium tomentosum]